jgi:acetyl-CoA carboxylase carboxyl transferase subunit alpha
MPPAYRLPFERPIHDLEGKLAELELVADPDIDCRDAIRRTRIELARLKRDVFDKLGAWEIVQVARHPERPHSSDYLELVFDEFVELHGDRAFGDDPAILTGFTKLDDRKVMFVGQQKGRTMKERTATLNASAHPEGYRKALNRMQMAAKYGLPVVCFIDTPGAYPGVGAEERGQAYQIALNLREMSRVATPIVCVVIGEGGSGGALGIGIGDHIAMLQHTYYSVISPEGCAGILWKDRKFADKAARALKFTSQDLKRLGSELDEHAAASLTRTKLMLRPTPVESSMRAVPVQSSLTAYVPVTALLTGDVLAEKSLTKLPVPSATKRPRTMNGVPSGLATPGTKAPVVIAGVVTPVPPIPVPIPFVAVAESRPSAMMP